MKMNLVLEACSIEELTQILKAIEENNQSGVKVKLTPNKPSTQEDILKEKIKNLIAKLASTKEKQLRELLASFNAKRFAEVKEEDFQDLYNLLKEMNDVQ